MKMLFIVAVFALSLGACTKKAVTRITVKVPDTFSGHVRLFPCSPDAREPVELNDMNEGPTSACPAGDVEIEVYKGTKTFVIPPERVSVRRSASGQPIAIAAKIP